MPDSAISVLPEGGLVLVTGISGYVGSNVADQILTAGYKVRGIVRSTTKARWLSDHFEKQYGADSFHLVEISDMLKAGALDEAVKGVSAIAHVATVAPLSGYPDPYIAQVTGLVLNLLESASREPKMKRFVFTSSSMAAANPAQDLERIITDRSWNEEACNDAWVGPFGDSNIWNVYAASKATAEQKAFEWMSANSPSFEFNSILPNTNFGPTLSREHQGFGSTGAMLKSVFDGNTKAIAEDPPQYFVDVRDTGRLHVIALTNPEVCNERLFAFAGPYNWNIILSIFRKMYPETQFPDDVPGLGKDISRYPNDRTESLLRSYGRPGWTSLEQSISDSNLQ